jgi:hypothetical protein
MHGACGVIDTIDERSVRLRQPLKEMSIKNIYVPELSYPTPKQIYKFKGVTQQKFFVNAVSLTPHVRFFDHIHISVSSKQNSNSDTVPLSFVNIFLKIAFTVQVKYQIYYLVYLCNITFHTNSK